MSPQVSVIIPSYNHARYLTAAMDSVLTQQDIDLELIVIDDGSGDESWEIIQQAAERDPRVRALHQENQGAHATISKGLALGRGEFLAILNSDDRYQPGRLSTLAALAQDGNGLDFIATGLQLIDADGHVMTEHPWLDEYQRMVHQAQKSGLWAALLERNFTVSTSNFFMRRSLWQALGPLRPLRYNMDWDYALRAWQHNPSRFAWRNDLILWDYRLHGSNTILGGLPTSAIEANHLLYRVLRQHYQVPGTVLAGLRRHHRLIRHQQVSAVSQARDIMWDARLQEALSKLTAAHDGWGRTRDAHEAALSQLISTQSQLMSIQASRSYRLGRALTAPVRWIRRQWQTSPAPLATVPLSQDVAHDKPHQAPDYRPIELGAAWQGVPPKVAVHIHLHYADLLEDMLAAVQHLPQPFHLFITTTQAPDALRTKVQLQHPDALVWQTPNQGKDIGPFVDALQRHQLDKYDLVLKLHGKKSRNAPGYLQAVQGLFGTDIRDGDDWRRRLILPLTGSTWRVRQIYQAFHDDPKLGSAGAARFICTAPDADENAYRQLCAGLGVSDGVRFFAGTMFWIRGALLRPLIDMGMTQADFGLAQAGQVEGTLEHGCERVFGALAGQHGYYLGGLDEKIAQNEIK